MRPKYALLSVLFCFLLAIPCVGQYPQRAWEQYRTPEEAGWSSEGLEAARGFYDTMGSAAFMLIHDGRVLAFWGDITRRYMCHSVRKSFLSALYGTHVDDGSIDINMALGDLGIDDKSPLAEAEKLATVRDLLKARSGVYHPAAYETQQMKEMRPERGSHDPNTFWYYNNWDFNTLCTILEQETGTDVFTDFKERIADPIGMQDFRSIDGYHHYEPDQSMHPAYPFKMSARDMARFGLLFLREGKWNGVQVVSSQWILESTTPYSEVDEGVGYAYMWWTRETVDAGRGFFAHGYGGHTIGVLPQANVVFVQRVDTYAGEAVPVAETMVLLDMILDAKVGEADPDPELIALEVPERTYPTITMEPARLNEYVGAYGSAGRDIAVRRYGEGLMIESSTFGNYTIFPMSEAKFFIEDSEQFLIFELKDAKPRRITTHRTEEVADLYGIVLEEGIEPAVRYYNEVEGRDPESHVFGEQDLNVLGYELLRTHRIGEAIEVFKLNVAAYPEAFNTYDSLGEAHMANGDYELAARSYRKSLELNPQNANAEEMLEKIEDLRSGN